MLEAMSQDLLSLKAQLKGTRQITTLRGGLGNSPAHLAIRATLTMYVVDPLQPLAKVC